LKKITLATIACIVLTIFIPIAVPAMAANPTPFTGDVEADFTGPGILIVPDPQGDVGLPVEAPGGTQSGWDIKGLRLTYDDGTDTLFVGINAYAIAGDAEGNGNPGTSAQWLLDNGGEDLPNFEQTECFAVYFDLDQNGSYDVIAGVSGDTDLSGFRVASTLGVPGNPAYNFGAEIPGHEGSVVAGPDIEFEILNFSTLPGHDDVAGFKVTGFMGSQQDNGIGEDFVVYSQSPSTITTISSSASSVVAGGTVDLTITEENDGTVNLTSPQVTVTQQGALLATLTAPPDTGDTDIDGVLDAGETWTWTITSNVLTADPTLFVASGSGNGPADIPVTYPDDPDEQDDVEVDILYPSTITTIEASPAGPVVIGATVDLTVTEENDGEVPLTSPHVEVMQGAAMLADLMAAPDSGDLNTDGILDPGETWSWTITSDPLTVNPTTFTATGYGTDPILNVITYPGDADEMDSVDVGVLTPSTITTIASSDTIVLPNDTVDLTVTEENDGQVPLTSPHVEVMQGAAMLADLMGPPDSGDLNTDGILDPGETWSWTIPSNPITVDPTMFTATGYGTDPILNVITYPDDPDEMDTVEVELIIPSTEVNISASAYQIIEGGSVDLTIDEKNDGDAELHNVQVIVNDGTSDIAVLTAPPDSGDIDMDDILDPGETWRWVIQDYGPIDANTTFTATGTGFDPDNNEITYPDDPEERDMVTVYVQPPLVGGSVYMESIGSILVPWISLFGLVAAGSVLLLKKKKWLLR
jgi:hypothetical protein